MDFSPAQKDATNKSGHNILVSAGAGSGKTTVLSARVMRILKEGGHISRLLILTFTNNAAHNMREKIKKDIVKDGTCLSELSYVDSCDIVTFDSYYQKLVRKYFYKLGISSSFQIVDSNLLSIEVEKKIDSYFAEMFQNNNQTFIDFLNKFTYKDEKDIKNFIISLYESSKKYSNPSKYLNNQIKNPMIDDAQIESCYKQVLFDSVNQLLIDYKKILNDEFIEDEAYRSYVEKFNDAFHYIDKLNSIVEIKGAIDYFSQLKASKKRGVDSPFVKKFNKIKANLFTKACKNLDTLPSEKQVKEIYYSNKDFYVFIYSIVLRLYEDMMSYKKHKSIYEFSDMTTFVLDLLYSNKDICDEIKDGFDEIMVDEYQDNNDTQEEFLNLISRNNLFMVGDVKQSIYNFRNSNPKYFMQRFTDYSSSNGGELIDMKDNYRSSRVVIDDINLIFDKLMFTSFGGADYKEYHHLKAINDKILCLKELPTKIYEYDDGSTSSSSNIIMEAKIIAEDIITRINNGEMIGGKKAKFGQFAIICDRGNEFDKITEVFESYQIPINVAKDEQINDEVISFIIKNLINLYVCISSNDYSSDKFKHALLSISRSVIGQKNFDEVNNLFISKDFINDSIVKSMKNIVELSKNKSLYETFQIMKNEFEFEKLLVDFDSTFDTYRYLIEYDNLFSQMDIIDYSLLDAQYYFDVIFKGDMQFKPSITDNHEESVTLINIHKSKGLEYGVIYYVGLSKQYNEMELKDKFSFSNLGLLLPYTVFDIKPEDKENAVENFPSNILKTYSNNLVRKESREEKIRLLYVALSRAMYQMIFLRHEKDVDSVPLLKDASSFDDLFDIAGCSFETKKFNNESIKGIQLKNNSANKNELKLNYTYHSINLHVTDETHKRASKLNQDVSDKLLELGTLVHNEMELVDCFEPRLDKIADEQIRHIAFNFVNSDFMKQFKIGYSQYHEYEYYDDDNNTFGSVDLLLVNSYEAVIIDYKLKHIDDDAYIKQLNTYRKNIERIFRLNVRCYLYALISGEVKEIKKDE